MEGYRFVKELHPNAGKDTCLSTQMQAGDNRHCDGRDSDWRVLLGYVCIGRCVRHVLDLFSASTHVLIKHQ